MFVHCIVVAAWMFMAAPHGLEGDTTDPAVKDFSARAQRYWDLHKKMDETTAPRINKKKDNPEDIIAHEKNLRLAIVAARANAAEGDIFTPAAQKIIVSIIQQELSSSDKGETAREMITGEGNPSSPDSKARVDLVVNANYPHNAPLSTVPPSVLLKLPKLPEGLEYRFVGRHLILYDSKANLIVDILKNAIR